MTMEATMDSSTFSSETGQTTEPNESGAPQVVNPVRGGVDAIKAETVYIEQGGVNSVRADHLTVRQGGVVKADVQQLEMLQGGIVLAQTETAHLTASNAAILLARGEVKMDQSSAQALLACGDVSMNQGGAVVMVARNVKAEKSGVIFLFAQKVEGGVRAMFGPRESVIFGVVAGLTAGLVLLMGRQVKRRKRGR
jgi:hypothetical protein